LAPRNDGDYVSGIGRVLFRHLPQAVTAQAIAAADRHRQDEGFLGAPAGSTDVAGERRSASGTGEAAWAGAFQPGAFESGVF
jgi:hypothetical protein